MSHAPFEFLRLTLTEHIFVWILCGLYAVLTFLPIMQLFWIVYQTGPEFTIQKTFLAFNICTCILRAIFFGLMVIIPIENFFVDSYRCVAFTIFNGLPRATFLTSFSLILIYWIEIIYIKHGWIFMWKKPFLMGNLGLFLIQIIFWILIFAQPEEDIPEIENYIFVAISVTMVVLFLYIGGKLYFMLKKLPFSLDLRTRIFEVCSVTAISTISFIIRALILFLTTFIKSWEKIVYMLFAYYIFIEIIPIGLVLLILNRIPNEYAYRKVKDISSTDSVIPTNSASSTPGYGSVDEHKPSSGINTKNTTSESN